MTQSSYGVGMNERRVYQMADLSKAVSPRLEVTEPIWDELCLRFKRSKPQLLGVFGASLGFGGLPVFIVEDLPVPWRFVKPVPHHRPMEWKGVSNG